MSRIIQKSLGLLAIAALGFVAVFAAAPQADAQGYGTDFPSGPIVFFATGGPDYTISGGGGGPYNLTWTAIGPDGTTTPLGTIVAPYEGDGSPPAGFFDGLPAGTYTIKVDLVGNSGVHTNSFTLTVTGAGAVAVPIAVPVAQPVAVPLPDLAFTGNDVSLPITAGAILIGSGGLLLLAANKRNRKV